jgi:hypothetical protein
LLKVIVSTVIFAALLGPADTFAMGQTVAQKCARSFGSDLSLSLSGLDSYPLTRDEEVLLFKTYKATQKDGILVLTDPDVKILLESVTGKNWDILDQRKMENILFLAFKPLASKISAKAGRGKSKFEREDLSQEAIVALLNSIRSYETSSELSFTEFATSNIQSSLLLVF